MIGTMAEISAGIPSSVLISAVLMPATAAGAGIDGSGQSFSASTDGQLDRFANAAKHFHQRVDGELGSPRRTRAGAKPSGSRPLRLASGDARQSGGQLVHQLLLQQLGVFDLLARGCLQALGLSGREAKLQEEVRSRLRHMVDFGIDLHFCALLASTTAR